MLDSNNEWNIKCLIQQLVSCAWHNGVSTGQCSWHIVINALPCAWHKVVKPMRTPTCYRSALTICLPRAQRYTVDSRYTLLKPKRHSLRCHGFVVHALLLRMHTNVVDFRVMRRLCHRKWNWQRNWQSVNQHSWDPWQWTTWSRRVTSDFNIV